MGLCTTTHRTNEEILKKITEMALEQFLNELTAFSLSKIKKINNYFIIEGDDGNCLFKVHENVSIEELKECILSFFLRETIDFIFNPNMWNILDFVLLVIEEKYQDKFNEEEIITNKEKIKEIAFSMSFNIVQKKTKKSWKHFYSMVIGYKREPDYTPKLPKDLK
jgi:hypothetical protein